MPPIVLALDLGGTRIRAAVVEGAALRHRVAVPTPVALGAKVVVGACLDALHEVGRLASAAGEPPILAVGISSPGPVDPASGVVVDPPNLGPTFHDIPLAGIVERELGLPAVLDRDTQVAALGEGAYGAAQGVADFVYVTVSTGVGGAVVSGGRLLRGPDGTAGELGHVLVDRDGPLCGCGARGHLEAFASGRAIATRAREALASGAAGTDGPLAALAREHGESFGAREVARAEEQGDPAAAAIMADARDAFAQACVSFADVFDPDLIVVGGGLAVGQGDRLLDPARDAVRRLAFRLPAARVRIVPAALGPDVSLVGAGVLARERL